MKEIKQLGFEGMLQRSVDIRHGKHSLMGSAGGTSVWTNVFPKEAGSYGL